MSIIEQAKELRELADGYKLADKPLAANTMYQAADTIESLSKKVAEQNKPDMGEIYKQINESKETIRRVKAGEYVSESKLARQLDCTVDIIESLTAKLQAANMDRSADCGGWIPCKDRLPEEKINPITQDFYEYQATFQSEKIKDIRHYKFGRGHWWNGPGIMDEYVIAWRQNLEPYHEP